MERLKKIHLTYAQKMASMVFSIEHNSFDWSKVVFMGLNKIRDFEMWPPRGTIIQHGEHSLRVVVYSLTSHQYESFLSDVILPMWNSNKNLIFMQVRSHN